MCKNINSTKETHYLFVKGKEVPVTKEVYKAYVGVSDDTYNENRRIKRNKVTFVSFEQCKEKGDEFADLLSDFENNLAEYHELRKVIETLRKDERYIVYAKFYLDQTNQEIANQLCISGQAVGKRVQRILKKIRLKLGNKTY